MSANVPIGSCCSKPRFNSVDGIDDDTWLNKLGVRHKIGLAPSGMSAVGPKLSFAARRTTTAIEGRADILRTSLNRRS
jgi:hypothetical protein